MRLPFFRAIIYCFNALIASALAGVNGPVALSQQGSSLPEIQQNQPQMVAPLRATIVDRDLPGGRENRSQGGWSAFQEETAPTGFDPDRRKDSNVMGVRSFNANPLPGNRENAFSSNIGGIPVRTSVSEGTRLNERGLNENWANEQGAGNASGSQWQGTGQNQTGFLQPQSGLPAVQGPGGQSPSSARDTWQPPGSENWTGGQLSQISNPSFQSNRGTSQGNFDSPLVNLPNNGMIAPGSRTLQNDRMDRPDRAVSTPSGDTLLARQRQIGEWDWSISLPEGSNSLSPLPREGRRASFAGDDGLDDTMEMDRRRRPLDERPSNHAGGLGNMQANLVMDSNRQKSPVIDPEPRAGTSTDQLASLLTVCFFLANLVLAYFLYDSRMKYQHLADEIQSRFFREP